jgi:hypothetical protein
MKSRTYSATVGAVALMTTLAMSVASGASVNSTQRTITHTLVARTATKTIICYRGKAIKRVTAVNPKCPAGWTTKKPVTKKPHAFSASYSGTIAMLWSASEVKVTALAGTGRGSTLGLTTVSGTGSSSPSSTCDPINGTGTLSGGGSTLRLSLLTTTKACATDSAAPTTATVTGTAKVIGGTGKFAGATGTLKVRGSFSIKSTTAGSSESDGFNATLIGTVITK